MAEENKKQWYVVNTYAGHENRVKENLLASCGIHGTTGLFVPCNCRRRKRD